jgi:hypothetical protein
MGVNIIEIYYMHYENRIIYPIKNYKKGGEGKYNKE